MTRAGLRHTDLAGPFFISQLKLGHYQKSTDLAFLIKVSYVIPELKFQLDISISSLVSKAHQAPSGYDPGGSFL